MSKGFTLDISEMAKQAEIKKRTERAEKCLKSMEQTAIDNEMTLQEFINCCQGLIGIYQRKAFNNFKIAKDE